MPNFHQELNMVIDGANDVMDVREREGSYGSVDLPEATPPPTRYRTFPRRWLILAVFCCYSASNAFQWNQYVIIDDIITSYYSVSTLTVEWTTMVYMLVYIPLILPLTYLLEVAGLRRVALLGSGLNLLGAAFKCSSFPPSTFYLALIGQLISGVGQVCILGLPAKIAAVWFGSNEVSTATSIGVFGNQIGIAFGFLIPPLVMHATGDDVRLGLQIQLFSVAAINALLFLLVWAVFQNHPPLPPSPSQAALQINVDDGQEEQESPFEVYKKSIKSLMGDRNFVLLLVAYGINVGTFYCVSTLLNRIISFYFPDSHEIAGVTGLVIIISGLVASVMCGIILDKTKAYKEVTFSVYVLTFTGMLMFTYLIRLRYNFLVYVLAAFLGFFMTGYLPVGFEYAAELTYPAPEGTSSGLLNMSAQVFGIAMILGGGRLLDTYRNPVWTGLFMAALLTAGVYLTYFVKGDLKRQRATHEHLDFEANNLIPAGRIAARELSAD